MTHADVEITADLVGRLVRAQDPALPLRHPRRLGTRFVKRVGLR